MRNIWTGKRKSGIKSYVFAFVLITACLIIVVNIVQKSIISNEEECISEIKDNISKTVVLCYSIEGKYPEDVEYMKEKYGFTYDESKYFIHYDIQGSNLMPMYEVFVK